MSDLVEVREVRKWFRGRGLLGSTDRSYEPALRRTGRAARPVESRATRATRRQRDETESGRALVEPQPSVHVPGTRRGKPRKPGSRITSAGGFEALRGVTFTIRRNEAFGLVGESGCGKTTLARAILHLDPPTTGSVRFDGIDLGASRSQAMRRLRRRMQIVFQDPTSALNPRLKVKRSLAEGLNGLGLKGQEIAERVEEATDHVGIPRSHLDRYPHEFSGGQKQRLVIARALTMRPEFLVLDEPVSNLDVSVQARIINLLLDIKERLELTYLFISHDLNLITYLSDRIGVMRDGKIVEIGPTPSIIDDPLHIYTRQLFSALAPPVDGSRDGGRGGHGKSRFTGCAFDERCTFKTSECVLRQPDLRWVTSERGIACHLGSNARPGTDEGGKKEA